MLLNESPSKGDPKMPLTGIWGTREWERGREKSAMSRSRILLVVLRDIPLKRKKSTGGLFLGAGQFIIALLHLVTGFVTVGDMLVVLGTEWIFFGLPTVTEKVTERSYNQNEPSSLKVRMRLFREQSTLGKLNISAIFSSQVCGDVFINHSTTNLRNLSLLSASLSSCACDGLDWLLAQSKQGGNLSLSHFFPKSY